MAVMAPHGSPRSEGGFPSVGVLLLRTERELRDKQPIILAVMGGRNGFSTAE